ncbi:K Homology domain-containing protein [Caenorhabditis elegans]|uniref:K Homology domain-containing protein n=1 Tax=Caenorhabditis elegans TaxID=6239 RepID=H2KZ81_CAEEL|nr:K Homology domain-containing protein [Caenorhabditis elegans]CCD66898.1 K Homology domain-containing protein [Caenorhabditis elegans]|eukprot:NP_510826.2 FUBp (FUBP) Like [Caenorhabditis elegans]
MSYMDQTKLCRRHINDQEKTQTTEWIKTDSSSKSPSPSRSNASD